MSAKQSRRDFWQWWREQAKVEKSIKVWSFADQWFWLAPHNMSGRAPTRHEAMGAAKAALRAREERENRRSSGLCRGTRAFAAGLRGASEAMGRTALSMGRAMGAAARLSESMERFAETSAESVRTIEAMGSGE